MVQTKNSDDQYIKRIKLNVNNVLEHIYNKMFLSVSITWNYVYFQYTVTLSKWQNNENELAKLKIFYGEE
jgi:hypothetical protein